MIDIQAELENIRFAWSQLTRHANIAGLQQAVMPLLSFFWHRSRFVEGRNLFRQAVMALEPLPATRERDLVLAMAQSNLAIFLMVSGDLDESTQLATTAQMLFETHQLPPPLGMDSDPRLTLANNARLLGDYETAVSHAAVALAHNRQHNNLRNVQEAYRMISNSNYGIHQSGAGSISS
ncbi:MAG: hypothetical protein GY805_33215 [Chloroflexi bacterium]|nr:hypothetical protein [Chloroflexota bacterium]